MPPALVTDVGFVLDPSASVLTACTSGIGGSTFTIRNAPLNSKVALLDMWRNGATAGALRIRSPKFADNVQGIRVACAAELDAFLLDPEAQQYLIPQDTLTVEMTGGTTETDTMAFTSYYDDLSGATPVLKMPGDISSQLQFMDTWVVNTTASGTIGGIAATAITNLYDVSQANRWYALLGYVTDTELTAVGITGADLSNLNIMGPGDKAARRTRRYFADLSLTIGKPCIPCFNSANKGNTTVQTADDAASTTANVSLIVAIMPEAWAP